MTPLVVALLLAQPASAPQVTLPLADYERLRKLEERPSLTVIDHLRIDGSFARRDLGLTLSGRSAGTLPAVDVLSGEGFRLHSCDGDALLSRAASGAFAVTPLAPRFRVRCRIALDGSDRLAATATPAVLEVAATVEDGEPVLADAGSGARSLSVVRRLAGAREDLPPSVAGRYQVTLLPDETRFTYLLDVRNPSRTHRRFEIALREAEHVEAVDAPVAWDLEGARYRFDLPPGESTIRLTGRLTGARFAPPVPASVQYLLVESHPLIRAQVAAAGRRVGAGETGLTAAYRGAQAFLLDGQGEVTWTATRLEALETAGFAVNALSQTFFLGADGKARSETTLSLDNQGTPALALGVPGEPTFASVGGEPAYLTRNADGRLFLPLGPGAQQVMVQDVRPFRSRLGVGVARLELPRTGVPASTATVELRYPAEWLPAYEELAPSVRWHLPDPDELLAIALLLVAAEALLRLGAVARRRRLALLGALALLALLSEPARDLAIVATLLPLGALALTVAWRRLAGVRRVLALVLGGGAALTAFAAAIAVVISLRSSDFGSGSYVAKDLGERYESEAPASPAETRAKAKGAPGYEGLPARIELPDGTRQTYFHRELLASDAPRPVFVVLVAARLVAALATAATLLLAALAFAFRGELAAGARTFAARFRERPPAPEAAAAPPAAGDPA
ncbi:hypothetical protein [Anaeromyxobacter oryzisoli]|uniref:hypothetical protein n=1 Tax=Anaeromyxobacter oryzisoli TaxID=2925408 RepID=UPI001F5AA5B6|nr:hypothetical protein [Anaeromyxobacter sp. SG63]